ncbi:WhiB family transcriptional regulator [Streptomyces sp. PA03-6a]|nr:WhiB family transcriptional regulator [Streptomyces sp. PA03-6a]
MNPNNLLPAWTRHAACADPTINPDLFFDEASTAAAISVCASCPVRRECLVETLQQEGTTGISNRYGVFGGLDPAQRHRMAGGPKPRSHRQLAECGTPSAYKRHVRRGEPIDEACRRANAEDAATRYEPRSKRVAA